MTSASEKNDSTRFAEGMLLATTLIWGGTFGATKLLVGGDLGPVGLLAWRFGIATLCLLPLFLIGRIRVDRATLRLGLVLGLLLYAGFGLQTVGLVETTSSRSGFITALYVIFTPLLQPLFGRRRPDLSIWIGVFIVMAGLWMLTGAGSLASLNTGDLLTLGCALSFAVYIVVLDLYGSDRETLPLTFVQLAVVAVLALLHRPFVEEWVVPSGNQSWMLLLYLALLATVFTTWAQTKFQPQTTPSRAAIIFTMESVFAAAIGALLLGEHLGTIEWIGGGLIVVGLLVVELMPGKRRTTDATSDQQATAGRE